MTKENSSKSALVAGSFTAFSFGMLYGVHRQFSKENFKIAKSHRGPFMLACRALLYGTILCFGSFAGGIGVFVGVTGITTLQQLSDRAQELFSHPTKLQHHKDLISQDKQRVSLMSDRQITDYWTQYFSPEQGDKN